LKVEIEGKKDNLLLERLEVNFRVDHEGGATPTREEVRDQLAKALKVEKSTIIVDEIRTEFGKQMSSGYAKVYKSVESAKKLERDHLLVRNALKEKG
jgi:small subunit ribosomal protein S24e